MILENKIRLDAPFLATGVFSVNYKEVIDGLYNVLKNAPSIELHIYIPDKTLYFNALKYKKSLPVMV